MEKLEHERVGRKEQLVTEGFYPKGKQFMYIVSIIINISIIHWGNLISEIEHWLVDIQQLSL